jgi:hypothetical protein
MISSAIPLVSPQRDVYTCISLIYCPTEFHRGTEHMEVTMLNVRIVWDSLTPSIA